MACVACTGGEGRPPLARIAIEPEAIVEDDGFQTAVHLDGSASADPLDHPDDPALTYAWTIDGDQVRFEGSRADSATPTIRLEGNRPAIITLTVTDDEGLSASAVAHMRLTVR